MRSWVGFVVAGFGLLLASSSASAQDTVFLPLPEYEEAQSKPPAGKPEWVHCTCDDLRKRLAEVDRMRDVYQRAYWGDTPWYNFTLTKFVGREMGWREESVKAKAKPEDKTTTEEERKQARADCDKCDWICDISMQRVHEGYHAWFTRKYYGQMYNVVTLGDLSQFNQRTFVKVKALSEIGAHEVEGEFLHDMIKLMEHTGKCDDVRGTPADWELQKYWDDAAKDIEVHMGIPRENRDQ